MMKLNNETVTIELKNGSVVHGTITGAFIMWIVEISVKLTPFSSKQVLICR